MVLGLSTMEGRLMTNEERFVYLVTLLPSMDVLEAGHGFDVMSDDRRGYRSYVRDVETVTWSRICAEWDEKEFHACMHPYTCICRF